MRTRFILLLVVMVAAANAQPAAAAQKPAVDKDVVLTNYETAAIMAGDAAWIALNWHGGGGDAENFRLEVEKSDAGVEIRYPENTANHSSLWADATLSDGEYDFTAVHVTVPYGAGAEVKLRFGLTYDRKGKSKTRSFNVRIPVVDYAGGEDLQQITTSLGEVSASEATWVGVSYAGLAPRLDDFQVTVTDPGIVPVTYPGDRSTTSLHHDARLEDGETDVARFRVDTSDLPAGTYTIGILASYRKDATRSELTGTVDLTVVDPGS